MRELLIALGVFGAATIIAKVIDDARGKTLGEMGRGGYRGHSNQSGPFAYWSRDIDSRTGIYVNRSKIRPWGAQPLSNAY